MSPPDELVSLRVTGVAEEEQLAWSEGLEVRLPRSLLDDTGLGPCVHDGILALPPDCKAERWGITTGMVEDHRLRAAFTDERPASSRLPISYQLVPPRLRSVLASILGRIKRRSTEKWARFPAWPLDLSADFLADLAGLPPSPFASGPTPVILSHDLDSPEGLTNLVRHFLDIEEAVGARSANYIVPHSWRIDHDLLTEARDRGHEIGIHGYDHSNRTAFCDDDEMARRIDAADDLSERYGIRGYRAPSLLRTRRLLRSLARRYDYDSSIPTSGGLFPVPNNGCASARPFEVEGLMEIPLSMPRDGTLRFLGHCPEEIAAIWVRCAEGIARSGGVVVLLTHCEARFSGNDMMLAVYRRFLDFISASDGFAWSSADDVLWRGLSKRATA